MSGSAMTTAVPYPSPGRTAVLPVDSPSVVLPAWSPIGTGDIDYVWLDLSLWSSARGGDIPTGAITCSVSPTDMAVSNITYVTGDEFTVGAIQAQIIGGTNGRTYTLTFSFTTTAGDYINRSATIQVIKR